MFLNYKRKPIVGKQAFSNLWFKIVAIKHLQVTSYRRQEATLTLVPEHERRKYHMSYSLKHFFFIFINI